MPTKFNIFFHNQIQNNSHETEEIITFINNVKIDVLKLFFFKSKIRQNCNICQADIEVAIAKPT